MKKQYTIAIIASILLITLFILMPEDKNSNTQNNISITATTTSERMNYFASHGWETSELFSKNIIIPAEFNPTYELYAQIQDSQGLPLRKYSGKEATLYTYSIDNYSPENRTLLAEMIVCNNIAVSAVIYDESDINYVIGIN